MKSTLFLAVSIMITSTSVLANRTCPENISFAANKLATQFAPSGKLSAKLNIISHDFQKCEYRGVDQDGEYASGLILRQTRRGLTSKGFLYVNFKSLSLKTMTTLKIISKDKIQVEQSTYRGVKRIEPTRVLSTESGKVISITTSHSVKVN